MKIKKTITITISDDYDFSKTICEDIIFNLNSEEIQLVLSEEKGEFIFLKNVNQTADFLKNVPDEIINKLSKRSYDVILNFFEKWIERLKKVRKL